MLQFPELLERRIARDELEAADIVITVALCSGDQGNIVLFVAVHVADEGVSAILDVGKRNGCHDDVSDGIGYVERRVRAVPAGDD